MMPASQQFAQISCFYFSFLSDLPLAGQNVLCYYGTVYRNTDHSKKAVAFCCDFCCTTENFVPECIREATLADLKNKKKGNRRL